MPSPTALKFCIRDVQLPFRSTEALVKGLWRPQMSEGTEIAEAGFEHWHELRQHLAENGAEKRKGRPSASLSSRLAFNYSTLPYGLVANALIPNCCTRPIAETVVLIVERNFGSARVDDVDDVRVGTVYVAVGGADVTGGTRERS
jgi:hypothetical protein